MLVGVTLITRSVGSGWDSYVHRVDPNWKEICIYVVQVVKGSSNAE